jgi:hypothetical protein
MAITTTLTNGNRTVTLTYIAENQKVLNILTDAAKSLYITQRKFLVLDDETDLPLTWNKLSNAQKLKVIDSGVREWLKQTARDWHYNEQLPLAQQTIITEGETNYDLGTN